MEKERKLRQVYIKIGVSSERRHLLNEPSEIYYTVWRLMEMAKIAFISRSYNMTYGLFSDDFIFESVGAHTNLVSGIVAHALDFYYGSGFGEPNGGMLVTPDGYSYRDVMEAVRIHDLAETEYGDIPDNGARDEDRKDRKEYEYFKHFIDTYSATNDKSRHAV